MVLAVTYICASKPAATRLWRPRYTRRQCCITAAGPLVRVYAVSDIHTDYQANKAWVENLRNADYSKDVMLLVGDISDDLNIIQSTLEALTNCFGNVFFVPGNHELWVRGGDQGRFNSVSKLLRVLDICADLGVHVTPKRWDAEADIEGVPATNAFSISDYAACVWPQHVEGAGGSGSIALAEWFDSFNEGYWDPSVRQHCDVISLAHFLPLQALLPEKRYLFYPNLAKAAGSIPLAERVACLRPDIHLFGHTHFSWDATIDGVRYIQPPLGYPSERKRRLRSLTFARDFDGPEGGGAQPNQSRMTIPGVDATAADWLPLCVYAMDVEGPTGVEAQDVVAGWDIQRLRLAVSIEVLRALEANTPSPDCTTAGAHTDDVLQQLCHPPATFSSDDDVTLPHNLPPNNSKHAPRQPAADLMPVSGPASWTHQDVNQTGRLSESESSMFGDMISLRHGYMCPPLMAHWSEYYRVTPRQPDNTQMAPWVAHMYKRRKERLRRSTKAGGSVDSRSDSDSSD